MKNKSVYISIDFEEWFHIPFLKPYVNKENSSISYCDKLDSFFDDLEKRNIKTTVFVVSEIANKYSSALASLANKGNVIGAHSTSHKCYKYFSNEDFLEDALNAKKEIEKYTGVEVKGFRAPMFSASYEQIQLLSTIGYTFDSSSINSNLNPFYNRIKSKRWKNESKIREYEIPTLLQQPIAGGGHFRATPLWIYKNKIRVYLKSHDSLVFFIHPYEIYNKPFPGFKHGKKDYGWHRYNAGLKTVMKKFWKLIDWMQKKGFEFKTME